MFEMLRMSSQNQRCETVELARHTKTPDARALPLGDYFLHGTLRTLFNINDLRGKKTEHYKKYGTLFVFNGLDGIVTNVTDFCW